MRRYRGQGSAGGTAAVEVARRRHPHIVDPGIDRATRVVGCAVYVSVEMNEQAISACWHIHVEGRRRDVRGDPHGRYTEDRLVRSSGHHTLKRSAAQRGIGL